MQVSAQMEQESLEGFLNSLDAAIDEARQVRSTIKSNYADDLKIQGSVSRKLMLVDREIELLESKLIKVSRRVGQS
ncbi:MAG: hypothetical protein HKN34_03140 [Gammaproteobacteria bacterium]|nr:hypothetical protein [Gammaproteobacteria bacterium]